MPNHCLNVLTADGNIHALNAFREKARRGKSLLSFEAFVPMPQDVIRGDVGHGTFVRQARGAWRWVRDLAGDLNITAPGKTWVEQHAWLCDYFAEHLYEVRAFRFATLDDGNIRELSEGLPDWLSWRSGHWGTKWDAYDHDVLSTDPTDGIISWKLAFHTAWTPPVPVIVAMQQQHPHLAIRCIFSEPGNALLGGIDAYGQGYFHEVQAPDGAADDAAWERYVERLNTFLYQ